MHQHCLCATSRVLLQVLVLVSLRRGLTQVALSHGKVKMKGRECLHVITDTYKL